MEPALSYRSKSGDHDEADLACDFMEQEVGRHDWRNNWPKFKADAGGDKGLERRVRAWLSFIGSDSDPCEIVRLLDEMVRSRSGTWR